MIVAGRRDRGAQETAVLVHCAHDGAAERHELRVVVRRCARIEQVALGRVAERVVQMLARAVDAGERLLVQEAHEVVLLGDRLQGHHHQLLMIGGDVGAFEHRRDFELAGGHFVVARGDRNAEDEQLTLELEHERLHASRDHAEVVILELLPFRRLGAEQGAARVQQVRARVEEVLVDQEVFLLAAGVRRDRRDGLVAEQLEDARGVRAERGRGAEHRGLGVERFAGPRHEGGRDAQRDAVHGLGQVGRAGHVPGGVAAGFGRGADAAAREARCVRLTLDQLLAGELGNGVPLAVGVVEAVVLLCRQTGERVEDVRVVRGTLRQGPVFQCGGDDIRRIGIEGLVAFDRLLERLVHVLREVRLHRAQAEHVGAEQRSRRGFLVIQRR